MIAALTLSLLIGTQSPTEFSFLPGRILEQDGVLYFGTAQGGVYAFDLETKKQIWKTEKAKSTRHLPLVSGDKVYVGGADGKLTALRRKSGEVVWEFEAGNVPWRIRDKFINGTPVLHDGKLIFSSEDYRLYAVNPDTGKLIWQTDLPEEPQAFELPIVQGNILLGTWDGYLYAVSAKTGKIMWKSDTEFNPKGVNYWAGNNKYRLAEGEEKWLQSEQRPWLSAVPAFDGKRIIAGRLSGEVFALDPKTGKQIWRYMPVVQNMNESGARLYVLSNQSTVVFTTLNDGKAIGLDTETGKPRWIREYGTRALGPMPWSSDKVMISVSGKGSPYIDVVEISTGKTVFELRDALTVPVVSGKIAYGAVRGAASNSSHIVGIDIETGKIVKFL